MLAVTAFRTGAPAQLAIGVQSFSLSTLGPRAFVDNAILELKLLEAMKGGSQMILTGDTENGPVRETVSLIGLATALAHVTQGCP